MAGVRAREPARPAGGKRAVAVSGPVAAQGVVGNHALHALLGSTGGGTALAPGVRAAMEARLGHGLGRVRLHTGAGAAASARWLRARAYTVGDDIVLGDGVEPLDTLSGRRTLAHELVHVVQQRLGGPAPGTGADSEEDADRAGSALAEGRPIAPIARGTAVGVARQPMDPRHARGHAGEQTMGFNLYRQEEGWIFFEGPSGSAGHGTTSPGFDGVAYNVKTGEIHLLDNKSLKATGNVHSAPAVDPTRNLGKNVDALIARVEAAQDVPGRMRLLSRLKALKAALVTDGPLPDDVKLVVTSQGGNTTDVSPRLKAAGVQHRSDPPPKNAPAAPGTTTQPTPQSTSTPTAESTPTPAPKPAATTAPTVEPTPTPKPTVPSASKAPVVEPTPAPRPTVSPPVRPASAWKAGLKAGGKALIVALIFAGLEYWVHKQLEKELEESIDKVRVGALPWAQRLKREDPSKPVYVRITVESKDYSRYFPLLGWMPESPVLHMIAMAMVREEIDPPVVEQRDDRLDVFHPGMTTRVIYTELMIP